MLQLIGTKSCVGTRRAERFLRERRVSFQFVDLKQRTLAVGELTSLAQRVGADALIDRDGPAYQKRGLAYMEFDVLEELARDPTLLRTPILRAKTAAVVGVDEAAWKETIAAL